VIIKVVGLLVLLVLVALAVGRALNDRRRTLDVSLESLRPPSPYPPSRGFKLLNGDEIIEDVRAPEVPRIDHPGELVFGEVPVPLPLPSAKQRHDERWALERSVRRMPQLRSRRKRQSKQNVAVAVVAVVIAVVVVLHLY
jgi:hypothetical protein